MNCIFTFQMKMSNYLNSLDFLSVNSLTDQPNKVGDDLAELKVTGPEFRYDFILIYCLLIFLKGGGTGMVVKDCNIYYTRFICTQLAQCNHNLRRKMYGKLLFSLTMLKEKYHE